MENHPKQWVLQLFLIVVMHERFKESSLGLRAKDARDKVQDAMQLSDDLIEAWMMEGYDFYYYLRQAKRSLQDEYHLISSPRRGYWIITQLGVGRFKMYNNNYKNEIKIV